MGARTKFRKGVCGILLNQAGLILVGERAQQKDQWQLPQGGIDPGETALQAVHREVAEEVGVHDLPILQQSTDFISYTWPAPVFADSKYGGQKHIYFLMDAQNVEIESLQASAEFSRFKWCSIKDILSSVIDWRKPGYMQAFKELGLIKG